MKYKINFNKVKDLKELLEVLNFLQIEIEPQDNKTKTIMDSMEAFELINNK